MIVFKLVEFWIKIKQNLDAGKLLLIKKCKK